MTYDEFVIYKAPDDEGKFIAHSIRSDQIGMGDTPVDATCELIYALRGLMEELEKHPERSDEIGRKAPKNIQDLYFKAKKLPEDIWNAIKERVCAPYTKKKSPKTIDESEVLMRDIGAATYYGVVLDARLAIA